MFQREIQRILVFPLKCFEHPKNMLGRPRRVITLMINSVDGTSLYHFCFLFFQFESELYGPKSVHFLITSDANKKSVAVFLRIERN